MDRIQETCNNIEERINGRSEEETKLFFDRLGYIPEWVTAKQKRNFDGRLIERKTKRITISGYLTNNPLWRISKYIEGMGEMSGLGQCANCGSRRLQMTYVEENYLIPVDIEKFGKEALPIRRKVVVVSESEFSCKRCGAQNKSLGILAPYWTCSADGAL